MKIADMTRGVVYAMLTGKIESYTSPDAVMIVDTTERIHKAYIPRLGSGHKIFENAPRHASKTGLAAVRLTGALTPEAVRRASEITIHTFMRMTTDSPEMHYQARGTYHLPARDGIEFFILGHTASIKGPYQEVKAAQDAWQKEQQDAREAADVRSDQLNQRAGEIGDRILFVLGNARGPWSAVSRHGDTQVIVSMDDIEQILTMAERTQRS